MKMLKIPIILSYFLISVYCGGEFVVLHSPASIKFKGQERLDQSLLTEVYSAALGQPVIKSSKWSGMYLSDPFNLAKAVATVAVDGLSDLDNLMGPSFPLNNDESEAEVFENLETRLFDRSPIIEQEIVRLDLSQGLENIRLFTFFNKIDDFELSKDSFKSLSPEIAEDREFLNQIQLLNAISTQIKNNKYEMLIPKVIWIKFTSYKNIINRYGVNSTLANEAKVLLLEAIDGFKKSVEELYNGEVLINVISNDGSLSRHVRAVTLDGGKEGENKFQNLHLASTYSDNFPVMFNIILWFSIIMLFTLLAICMAIGDMDPGRDSIIYRMTSTRMKKDN